MGAHHSCSKSRELSCKKLELHVVIAAELMIVVVGCRWPRGFAHHHRRLRHHDHVLRGKSRRDYGWVVLRDKTESD
jgi:hypothetical protein